MTTKSFERAFNTIFHDEALFRDFCESNLASDVEEFFVGNAGKQRKVIKAKPKLKSYLRFIDKVVLKHLKVEESVVHSYLNERSTATAVSAHVQNKHFLVSDIENFFSSISSVDVRLILEKNKSNIPISDFDKYIPRITKLVCWDDCLPIGFPTSPRLSNSALFDFDKRLFAYCRNEGIVYTRYSDDLIFSAEAREPLERLKDEVQNSLKNITNSELRINKEKTKIYKIGQPFNILGLVITQYHMITIAKKYKNKLELALHYFVTDKLQFHDFLENHFNGKEQSLFGMLHYAKSVDPAFMKKLQRKYGAYSIAKLLENKWND